MQMVKNSGGVGGNGFDGNGLAGGNGDGQQSVASLYDASSMDSQNTVRESHPSKCICVVTMAATAQQQKKTRTHRSRNNYSFLCVAWCRNTVAFLREYACVCATNRKICVSLFYVNQIEYIFQIGSLIIESAKKRDSGNYTCRPSNSPASTVTLHVISSE